MFRRDDRKQLIWQSIPFALPMTPKPLPMAPIPFPPMTLACVGRLEVILSRHGKRCEFTRLGTFAFFTTKHVVKSVEFAPPLSQKGASAAAKRSPLPWRAGVKKQPVSPGAAYCAASTNSE